ncbi:hypothetical protein DFQ28_002154 [Apophysomyces sp. BC1034]|nr:hypothetical protein DFQ30_007607 [Apophysomyces sp. BC1015]KAG0179799.1 hypothetical protein DFQ29_001646 [Apophysomyces sp. BC1021]KAG0190375.1 hypothetical protein DFQ28_002154 [Apophysomyces sp. BC1034]
MDSSRTAFKKSDFSFLHDFKHIIDLVLSGSHQDEVGKAMTQLDERFQHGRRVLEGLPGLQYVKEEQEEILAREQAILDIKKEQFHRYLSLPTFNSSTPP